LVHWYKPLYVGLNKYGHYNSWDLIFIYFKNIIRVGMYNNISTAVAAYEP